MATPRTGRPRGRPPGAKNLAKTLDQIVLDVLEDGGPKAPPRPIKPKGEPKGPWKYLKTPEERSAYARKLAACGPRNRGQGRKKGVPLAYTSEQYALLLAQEKPKIDRIMKKMAIAGELPDDPRAVESLTAAVTVLRTAETTKDKLAAAALILSYTKAKPTAKVEHTIRSAEDYLDELAEDDGA